MPKDWFFWTVELEKTLESLLDYKEIKPINSKGNQSWIFIGRTDAEAEAPILHPPDAKSWHIKDPMLRKIECKRRRWQRTKWLDGITNSMNMSFSKLWDGEGQVSLVRGSPWGYKKLDMTKQLNNKNYTITTCFWYHTFSFSINLQLGFWKYQDIM